MSEAGDYGRFERVTPYDVPMTLLEQALDGEWHARTYSNTVFDSMRLSPEEREGVRSRLKAAAGNNRVTNALVDVALNPWVWLMTVTSPAGARAIHEGRAAFGLAGHLQENGGVLAHLGALGGSQMLKWGQTNDALNGFERAFTGKLVEGEAVTAAWKRWAEKVGVSHTNPRLMTPDDQAKMERAGVLVHTALVGRGEDVARRTVKGVKDLRPDVVEHMDQAWVAGVEPEKVARGEGLGEVLDSLRSFYEKRGVDQFAKEGTRSLVDAELDGRKIVNQWRGLDNGVVGADAGSEGARGVWDVMKGEGMKAVKRGDLTPEGFYKLAADVQAEGMKGGFYEPRNQWATDGVVGEKRVRGQASALKASGASVLRMEGEPVYSAESMAAFERVWGDAVTPAFREAKAKYAKVVGEAKGEVRTLRIDPYETAVRYNEDTARSWAWHVAKAVDDEELGLGQLREWGKKGDAHEFRSPHAFENLPGQVGGSTTEPFADAAKMERGPMGYHNYADAVSAGYVNMTDDLAKGMLKDVFLPAVARRTSVRHAASTASLLWSRKQMGLLADSWIGRSLEENGGAWGERIVGGWKKAAELGPEEAAADTGRITSGVANLLYTTHLGWNVGSALINLTQPLSLAATELGGVNVMAGYGEGFKALGAYLGKRWGKYGMRPITELEREKLIAEAVPDAHLLGLMDNQVNQLDKLMHDRGTRFGGESPWQKYMGYALGMFTNAEMVNRVTVMGAVNRAYRTGGRAVELGGPAWRKDVRNFVRETQFGSHPLTTPAAMMSEEGGHPWGRVLANPLTRMFMSFPLRTLTGAVYTNRYMGGVDRGKLGVLRDFGRAMGISAVMYEAGKNLAGVNLERAGFFAGVTDLLPGMQGGRFDEREGALPTPPVIDIPYSVVKALATEDRELLGQTLWRVFPFGGVAAGRALQALPPVGRFPAATLQKQYVRWGDRDEEGRVGVFKEDGTFLGRQHPTAVILKAFGADLGAYRDESEFVGYIGKQQDEIRAMRRQAVGALLEGRQADYERTGREFEKKFGVPLVVTQAQLRMNQEQRVRPRAENVLGGLPASVRPLYRGVGERSLPGVVGARSKLDTDLEAKAAEAAGANQKPPPYAGYGGY